MNIKRMIALIGVAAAASQATLLWNLTVTSYEVQVPTVVDGSCGSFSTCAGWWYGYDAYGGSFTPNQVVGADTQLVTSDTTDGSAIVGGNLTATGIKIHLNAPAAANSSSPGMAGMGFDYNKDKSGQDISATGGYAIAYTSTLPLQLELGWDEATYKYDTWYATLPAHATSSLVQLPWSVFKKDGYTTGAVIGNQPITTAETKAVSMKIRLKNGTATAEQADLEVQCLSTLGSADCNGPTAAVLNENSAASFKANLIGRSISFAGLGKASVSVEVIGLQGQVVASQTVSAASKVMDLSKLANGVYVVKASSKSINFSKMIALK
jgi:hypothetical protein